MTDMTIQLEVRTPRPGCSVIELAGEVTGASEAALADAYERAAIDGTRAVVLERGRASRATKRRQWPATVYTTTIATSC